MYENQNNFTDQTTAPDFSSSPNINYFWCPQFGHPQYLARPAFPMPFIVRPQMRPQGFVSPPIYPVYPLGSQNFDYQQTNVLRNVLNINTTGTDLQPVPDHTFVPYQSFNNKLQTGNLKEMLNITSHSKNPIDFKHHLVSKQEQKKIEKLKNTTQNFLSKQNQEEIKKLNNTSRSIKNNNKALDAQKHDLQSIESAIDQISLNSHCPEITNMPQQEQIRMVEQNSSNKLSFHTKITTANASSSKINNSIVQQQHMQDTSINRSQQKFKHSPLKTKNSSKLNTPEKIKKIPEYYNMSRNHKDKYENSNPRRMYTLMSPEDFQAGKKSHWSDLEITGSVRNLSPHLWQMTHLTVLYMNDNSLQRLPPEIGRLVNLRILDLSSNKLRSLPAELGDLIYLRELLLNQNFLRVLPYELGKLFQLQVLGLQGNPLSKEVMTLYGNGESAGTNKLLTYMLDNLQVTANHPPQRPWIPLTRPNRTRPTCIFTVMCYNVLCDKYATRQMYGYCPSWALDWEYRKKGILDEIRHYAADIISLQEVETDQFYNFFLPELKHDGYDGIFSPKSRAKTMAENDRKYVDGCAIFYRTAKFSLIKEHLVEFNQLAMANAEGSDNMLNRVMPKDNIGLAALLRTKEAAWDNGVPSDPAQVQQPILVCTAHIHWDPEFCDVKLIQTMMLSNELRSILDQAGQSFRPGHKPDSSNVQLLLCGDFNSLPDSGVIEFLTSGRVAADHRDFKDLAYKSCLQKISGCDKPNEFTHSFKLASAYSEDIMPYTNYTFEFKGIIDYIFYSKQSMVPLGLLGPLSPEWFKEHKVVGCPHPHVPSDHFPLLVELEMTPTVGTSNGLISRR